jgi:hypothetical protein
MIKRFIFQVSRLGADVVNALFDSPQENRLIGDFNVPVAKEIEVLRLI